MKSSHKTNIDLCFIIQQLTLDKLFKCDCAGRKKKHGFGSFQKWQIWANFTIEKTQLVHGISTWNKHCFKAHRLLFLVLKNFWRHSIRAPSRDQNLKGILTPRELVKQTSYYASKKFSVGKYSFLDIWTFFRVLTATDYKSAFLSAQTRCLWNRCLG